MEITKKSKGKTENMIQFQCDYEEGAHPLILQRMLETNMEQTVGYGLDPYCMEAANKIKKACKRDDINIHFLVGGTQTNTTVIASTIMPYEGVIAADTGHINVHETGAIEATGHKVLALPNTDGKITAAQIEKYYKGNVEADGCEHTVRPGMVYISQPTELGTIYSKKELEDIYAVCKKCELPLFVDGARLGYGLMAKSCDMTIEDLAANCDAFYIGGTKVGALFGEAVVISNERINKNFRYMIKQHGGMLAKGRLLGLQFDTLFTDNLYWDISKQANALADEIRAAFDEKKIPYLVANDTNQIFPVLPDKCLDILKTKYEYCYQERVDETHSAVRFCTSWATTSENVKALCEDIKALEV